MIVSWLMTAKASAHYDLPFVCRGALHDVWSSDIVVLCCARNRRSIISLI